LVTNTRLKTKKSKKQLSIEARYLSKVTADALQTKLAQKEAEIEIKKTRILEKKAATAIKQAETRRKAALRQLLRTVMKMRMGRSSDHL
jgi:hypothetical protein